VRPQFYAARARSCAAGNARKFCLPSDDAQQLPRDFQRHPERRDDQVCRELHARDPHQSKRPEDVKALIKTAEKNGYKMGVLKAVEEVNEYQKTVLFKKLAARFGGVENLKGKTIAMWGLAFKPETDDMREATALVLIDLLVKAGAVVRVYDPVAMNECKRRMTGRPDAVAIVKQIVYCNDMFEALLDADALLLVTEWKQFRMPSFGVMKKSMKNALIIDGRNIYDPKELAEAGFEYSAIGCSWEKVLFITKSEPDGPDFCISSPFPRWHGISPTPLTLLREGSSDMGSKRVFYLNILVSLKIMWFYKINYVKL